MANTNDSLVYLRPETRIEALCCRWWAWSHLISPIQQAMNVAFRQLPLLQSFIDDTEFHINAADDPDLIAGPFVHLSKTDLSAARALLHDMNSRCSHLIEFAKEYAEFDRTLHARALGRGVDALYDGLPTHLFGAVELSYDMSNNPQIRLFEDLADDTGLRTDMTHEIMFSLSRDEHREFFLNTPRLDRQGRVFAQVAFDSAIFDDIAKSRIAPISLEKVSSALGVRDSDLNQFRTFFDVDGPQRIAPSYLGDDVRLRHFGHACALIQTSRVSILIDPMFAWERDTQEASFVFSDLPDFIDYVVITHNHPDHFCPEILLQLRRRVGKIIVPRNNQNSVADPSMKSALRRLGFHDIEALDPLDTFSVPDGAIMSLPFYGEHGDLNIFSKQTIFIQLKGRQLLFLVDSLCADRVLFQHLARRLGRLDALFIGMECHGAPLTWLYGPYIRSSVPRDHDESRRLSASDCKRAWAAVEELRPARAYVYAMGQEPWLRHLFGIQYSPSSVQIVESKRFVECCREAGITAEYLYGCSEFYL